MQTMNWKKTEVEGAQQLPCVSLSKELNRQKSCLEANHARSACVCVGLSTISCMWSYCYWVIDAAWIKLELGYIKTRLLGQCKDQNNNSSQQKQLTQLITGHHNQLYCDVQQTKYFNIY